MDFFCISVDYCKDNVGENIAHPYAACRKFVRCIPGDVVVQLCPTGTCFWPIAGRCVRQRWAQTLLEKCIVLKFSATNSTSEVFHNSG